MVRRVDYDEIAATFDRRYQEHDYSGVEAALDAFVGERAACVLEVGCGTGHWLERLAGRGVRVAGLDPSAGMLCRAKTRVPGAALVQGTAERLPWGSASFDRVFCVNALHHFPDKVGFVQEAMRVSRPGGRVMTIGLDPHAGVDRWYIYEYFDRVLEIDRRRYPSTVQVRAWMRAAGFVDCVTREIQHWDSTLDARAALERGRLDRRMNSQMGMLTEEAYRQGIARIRAAVDAAESPGESLALTVDLRLYGTIGTRRLDASRRSGGADPA